MARPHRRPTELTGGGCARGPLLGVLDSLALSRRRDAAATSRPPSLVSDDAADGGGAPPDARSWASPKTTPMANTRNTTHGDGRRCRASSRRERSGRARRTVGTVGAQSRRMRIDGATQRRRASCTRAHGGMEEAWRRGVPRRWDAGAG
ncbi:hypothetical protein DCS_00655 [Drechmeria coniospora]|uniref:Uncharacterized protein n=1 Tax=Drechmeria coniospora TaxID=98403 RepID=A0A151GQY3_DRECN|nr:hypothetical protein DCS_00655 [Drechmeria coniospora]KYK59525.1 hypothetical protein DCS_00655 [Drechmeria coniospora]